MNWSKTAVIVVIAVFAVSYGYSAIKRMHLSGEVQETERKACAKQGAFDCDLIAKYHDECFEPSYRAEYRIKSFHADEYRACIENMMNQHLSEK